MFLAGILSVMQLRLLCNSVSVYCSNLCYSKWQKAKSEFGNSMVRPILLISRFGPV